MGACAPPHPAKWALLMAGPARRYGRHYGRPGLGGQFFGPGRRAGRGDIRAAILVLLAGEPMHGYQVIREITERSGGVWKPSPGSVYPTLQQLEDEGLVRAREADGRRVFELTDDGRAEAAKHEGTTPWQQSSGVDDETLELRDLAMQVLAATRQVVHAGGPGQVAAAAEVLRTARRSLYRLLAEDDAGTDAPAAEE
jgi:DNA-binding PadR family transcriptional regulator